MAFSDCWERIRGETDLRRLTELARLVGTTQQFVSRKKKEGIFPVEWAYKVAREYNLLTEWILTGEGPRSYLEFDQTREFDFPILQEIDAWLKGITVKEPQRVEWFSVSFQDAFPMFREWKKRREKEESASDIDPQSNVA